MCVLECFLIGDFLVGDPPPVTFFGVFFSKRFVYPFQQNTRSKIPTSGTFSTSWKLESTVRNILFGRRLFFFFLTFIQNNSVKIRSRRIPANSVTFKKKFLWFGFALIILRGSYKETCRRGPHNVNKFTSLMKNSPKFLICLKHQKDYNYSLQVFYVIRLGKAVGLTLLFSSKLSFHFHSNSLTKAQRE